MILPEDIVMNLEALPYKVVHGIYWYVFVWCHRMMYGQPPTHYADERLYTLPDDVLDELRRAASKMDDPE